MIVSCEECGKKYRVDTDKIKGDRATFTCKACGNPIIVHKPTPMAEEPLEPITPTPTPEEARPTEPPKEEPAKAEAPKVHRLRLKGMGLRGKLMTFLLIPLILALAIGAFFSLRQIVSLSGLITGESSKMVTQMAEKEISSHARAVAMEVRLFLVGRPELKKEEFQKDVDLKRIAVQKVGLTGYSALYELPGRDGIWRTWAHANPKIVAPALDDMSKLKKPMGRNFLGFWGVYTGVEGGKESSGYYTWLEKDGSFRDKFMVCTPIEGTPYIIASTTYLDEFTLPLTRLKRRCQKLAMRARNINIGIMAGTIVLIGLIVFFYGRKLTGNIRHLSEIADRISIGEMDAEIEVKSKDEIGELSEAISRMQDSLRLAIERLRRRR